MNIARGCSILLLSATLMAQKPGEVGPRILWYVQQERQTVEPIAFVSSGPQLRFDDAIHLATSEADVAAILQAQESGIALTLFGGGQRIGSTRIRAKGELDGVCFVPPAPLADTVKSAFLALSGNANNLGHLSDRRIASKSEIETFRRLSSQWLIDFGLDRSLVARGELSGIVSTTLKKAGNRTLIGRLDVTTPNATHRLFAVVEVEGSGPKVVLAHPDVMRDEFETDVVIRSFVDQIDLNQDGVDEIVTHQTLYEGWSYSIFSLDPGRERWTVAYDGGGCSL